MEDLDTGARITWTTTRTRDQRKVIDARIQYEQDPRACLWHLRITEQAADPATRYQVRDQNSARPGHLLANLGLATAKDFVRLLARLSSGYDKASGRPIWHAPTVAPIAVWEWGEEHGIDVKSLYRSRARAGLAEYLRKRRMIDG